MILQFTTGSVEDRQKHGIHISVLNAGIQPANVIAVFRTIRGDSIESVVENRAKVPPQEESVVLDKSGLRDVHCEVLLKVDSPSLIVTIIGETRFPLHCQTLFVDDVEENLDSARSSPRSISLLWGYTSKGDPF